MISRLFTRGSSLSFARAGSSPSFAALASRSRSRLRSGVGKFAWPRGYVFVSNDLCRQMVRARVKVSCRALSMTAIDGTRSSVLLARMRPPAELEFQVSHRALGLQNRHGGLRDIGSVSASGAERRATIERTKTPGAAAEETPEPREPTLRSSSVPVIDYIRFSLAISCSADSIDLSLSPSCKTRVKPGRVSAVIRRCGLKDEDATFA